MCAFCGRVRLDCICFVKGVKMKRIILYLSCLVCICVCIGRPGSAHAGLEAEMQRMFNDMVNVSDGGYYKGVGRGVVAGPSVTIRHPSYDIHLLDFRPPSISAGCGGFYFTYEELKPWCSTS